MYSVGDYVQITNHSDPECNGQYGHILKMQVGYDGSTYFYTVELDDSNILCTCIDDEIMEG
jgi:hypothetical protein